jgi:hypothetical protein
MNLSAFLVDRLQYRSNLTKNVGSSEYLHHPASSLVYQVCQDLPIIARSAHRRQR